MTRLWHGFAPMGAVDKAELVLERGEGCRVWDAAGNEYLDAAASLWFVNVGYGRQEIAEAVARQMAKLSANHCFGDHANDQAIGLADRVIELSPFDEGAVFFGSGGSDAVDSAGKISRRYWSLVGQPEKTVIASRRLGYHGMHAYGTSLAGIPANKEGLGELVGDTVQVAWDDPSELAGLAERNPGRIAAFIGEPVMGAGAVMVPPDDYWREIERICREHDILYISDEVICGFGRLGTWFGCQTYGVTPDIMTCAKGISSGYIPLGAAVVSSRIKDAFWAEGAPPFRHGVTYMGHPVACAAAHANLDIIEREGLVDRVREMAPTLTKLLEPLRDLPLVADVRSKGLMGAVEFTAEALADRPTLSEIINVGARRHGVLTRGLRGVGVQISPPFVVTEDELSRMIEGIANSITDAAQASGAAPVLSEPTVR